MFAYAIASLSTAAVGAAYDQHLWVSFKRAYFSLNELDDLFALKSMPTGFFNVELLGHAKLAQVVTSSSW